MKELVYPFDAPGIMKKKKSIKRRLLAAGSNRLEKKIAVLGGSTTSHIVDILELFLLDYGIAPKFYECEYAQFEQEALFPSEEFLNFHPDLIFIHTSSRNVRQFPELTDGKEQVEEKLKAETERFRTIWEKLTETFGCPIIQNNFEMPFYRLMGNRDASDYRGRRHFLERLNEAFYQYAESHDNFYINDMEYLAADYGLKEWTNPYYWNMYKYCMCPDAIPAFAFSVAHIIKSIWGRNKKALALDLDNTLWGGVIGDDGQDGIDIGQENGVAQSYYEFQSYLKQLKPLGVLLTVDSKNEEENAREGLLHPDGVLKPDDFVVIKANWENKDRNLLQIASELNILPESIVFVDDNPAERAIVEGQIDGVVAPVMDSVENYITTLDRNGFFEVTSFSEDDLKRNDMYKANALRNSARADFADYGDYLKSLEMMATIRDFDSVYLARIAQLTNKSNQFNLTTRRYTLSEIEAIRENPNYIRLYGKLVDKFGDNGVVSVVIGEIRGKELHIDLWLMSCRVLKRGMEQAMLDQLVEKCTDAGIETIYGYYYPTKKNKMVKELYQTFGFIRISENENGDTVWKLETAGYEKQNHYIQVQ